MAVRYEIAVYLLDLAFRLMPHRSKGYVFVFSDGDTIHTKFSRRNLDHEMIQVLSDNWLGGGK